MASSTQLVVERVQRVALHVQIDVPVHVHGHFDATVADDLHHDAGVHAEGEQQAHAGATQGVQPDPA